MNDIIDPVKNIEGKKLAPTEMLKGIGDALGDVRRALETKIDALDTAHKRRSIDLYEEIAMLKSSLADNTADKNGAGRELAMLRREISGLRDEIDSLRRGRYEPQSREANRKG